MSDAEGSATEGSDPADSKQLRLGGMALRNGLLVHGPTHWAVAVRNKAGEIEVASGPQAHRSLAGAWRRRRWSAARSGSPRLSPSSRSLARACARHGFPSRTRA